MSELDLTSILIKWRRYLHQYPELGFLEYNTTYQIGQELASLGFSLHVGKEVMCSESRKGVPSQTDIDQHEQLMKEWGVDEEWIHNMKGGHTGVIACWDTGKPGKHMAFRFDIDALPIDESTDSTHSPFSNDFRSTVDGVMHACGHDGHTATGIALAHYLSRNAESLSGRFTLIFQPAEEGGRGAKPITDQGWLQDVDEFYTGHIGIKPMPIGTIAASVEGFLASSKLNAWYKGQSAHAGMNPEHGRNALLAAATASTQLNTIPRHSEGASRINVGKLYAGSGRNIIADSGYMELETRGETTRVNQFIREEATRIIHASADLHGVSVHVEEVGETSALQCSNEAIDKVWQQCQGNEKIQEILPVVAVSGSEDASFMMNKVQQHNGVATYMLFGTPLAAGHHHPSFDFDEEVLVVALETYIRIIQGGYESASVVR